MTIRHVLTYFFLSILIYLVLPFVEYYTVYPLIQGFNLSYLVELLIVVFTLLIINPLVDYAILLNVPYTVPGLKKTGN